MRRAALLALALGLGVGPAAAATKGGQPVSILPGGDAKSPISIEADKLDYFEKEGKAVYDGHVVVEQGDTKLTCSRLTILMETSHAAAKPGAAQAGADASSRLRHMDCAGPVTVRSKTQTATADNGSYDKIRNDVVLSGHVVLTDGRNVTKGDRLVYDLNTGQAAVQGGARAYRACSCPAATSRPAPPKRNRSMSSRYARAISMAGFRARAGGARMTDLAARPQVAEEALEGEPSALGTLAVYNLGKRYGQRAVVQDVSLVVRQGEAVGLLGPNGAGKTTVFYMITGLVKPDKGVIALDGNDVTGLPMYQRARLGVGYLPQEASIFRGLNVEDNIRAVLEVNERDRARREQRLEQLLEEFDIARLRKSPSIALSGGERRRCEIARALAARPAFILLDEPFAGIDPIAVGDIQDLVRHLKQRGIGVLITDHNVRETLGLIDRAYIIHSGSVLTQGAPEEIIAHPDARRLYLGESFRM